MSSSKLVSSAILLAWLWPTLAGVQCYNIMYGSPEERAIRTWTTRLLAEYSTSSDCLAVAFSSVPNHQAIGVFWIKLIGSGAARNVGPMNVSWEFAQHFAAAGSPNASFTLLKVPMPPGLRDSLEAYKVHLKPLMYRNNTEVISMVPYSKLQPQCHVTFSRRAALPQRLSLSSAPSADCASRWGDRPASLDEAFRRLKLRVADDGCCLSRFGVELPQPLVDAGSDNSPRSLPAAPHLAMVGAAAATAGVAASLLAACCALAAARARRLLRRKRIALAPSGAPYSLLTAHCRSVHTKEPLLNQGMAYRVCMLRWDFTSLCRALLRPVWLRL
ncbi:hypothetical protein BOX15_Mlig015805g2 [Macrostomum lignano]|uniref:Uncharacterized protein n=1 Tax=Macrostomum lignano TaxID=282301 RepID=A0A267GTM4_9PLAT|nr:hypothetical protein BOX15_Mlig015805g2 [Macrostomum lignano]